MNGTMASGGVVAGAYVCARSEVRVPQAAAHARVRHPVDRVPGDVLPALRRRLRRRGTVGGVTMRHLPDRHLRRVRRHRRIALRVRRRRGRRTRAGLDAAQAREPDAADGVLRRQARRCARCSPLTIVTVLGVLGIAFGGVRMPPPAWLRLGVTLVLGARPVLRPRAGARLPRRAELRAADREPALPADVVPLRPVDSDRGAAAARQVHRARSCRRITSASSRSASIGAGAGAPAWSARRRARRLHARRPRPRALGIPAGRLERISQTANAGHTRRRPWFTMNTMTR